MLWPLRCAFYEGRNGGGLLRLGLPEIIVPVTHPSSAIDT